MALPMKSGRPFLFRSGGQFFWKGMSTKTDLGAQPPDRPRLLLNGRVIGGHIVARPPIKTVVALVPFDHTHDAQAWRPTFLTEHHSYNGVRLWWGAKDRILMPGADAMDYQGVAGYIDTDYDLEWHAIASYTHKVPFVPIVERFANSIYVGDYGALRRVYRIQPEAAFTNSGTNMVRAPADEVIASYDGRVTTALHNHEGRLYYVISDPTSAVNAEIWSWDGQQQVKEKDVTWPGVDGIVMQTYQDSLIVAVRGMGGIYKKSPVGVWTFHSLGGFNSSPYMNSMAELKNKLYIVDGGVNVFSWDGTTLALERTIATGINPEKVNCCVAFNGRLYYFWDELVHVDIALTRHTFPWVGMYDPDTVDAAYKWKDDYKYLGKGFGYGTQIGTDVHADGDHFVLGDSTWTAAAVYRQRIVGTCGSYTYSHSMANNPYSTWSANAVGQWNDVSESPMMLRGPAGWPNSVIPYYLKAL